MLVTPVSLGLDTMKQHTGDQSVRLGNRDMRIAVAMERLQAVLAHESINPVLAAVSAGPPMSKTPVSRDWP